MQTYWSQNSVYMRSSASMRNTPSFLHQHAIPPPLLCRATLDALEGLGAVYRDWATTDQAETQQRGVPEVRFSQREADSDAAALAESLSAYCLSKDSDYYVLCGRGRGSAYVPLEGLSWGFKSTSSASQPSPVETEQTEDDGFQPVQRKGRRKGGPVAEHPSGIRQSPSPIAQPAEALESFTFNAYSVSALAHHLGIPSSLLPLLATLTGNDYFDHAHEFFPSSTRHPERIRSIAAIIASEWKAYQKRRSQADLGPSSGAATPIRSGTATPTLKSPPSRYAASEVSTTAFQDPVRWMLICCIKRLLQQAEKNGTSSIPNLTVEEMAERAIDSIVQYGKIGNQDAADEQLRILFRNEGGLDGIPLESSVPSTVLESRRQALNRYTRAFYRGRFSPLLFTALVHRHVIQLDVFFEDPNSRSLQITHCRSLRYFTWAILFSAYGLNWARTPEDLELEEEGKKRAAEFAAAQEAYLDEVISVATTDSFSHQSDDGSDRQTFPLGDDLHKPDPYVWVEVRRGERLSCEAEPIATVSALLQEADYQKLPPSLADAFEDSQMPACLLPEAARQSLRLFALSSLNDAVESLPTKVRVFAACVRHCIIASATDAPERRSTHWLRPLEVQAFILAGLLSLQKTQLPLENKDLDLRHIHLSSMLLFVLEATAHLSEALLLDFHAPNVFYEGSTFHRLLAVPAGIPDAQAQLNDPALFDQVLAAVTEGLQDYLFAGATKAERKERKKKAKEAAVVQQQADAAAPRFGMSEDVLL